MVLLRKQWRNMSIWTYTVLQGEHQKIQPAVEVYLRVGERMIMCSVYTVNQFI